jgi:DNA-binding transcriptional LysR family regulator
MDVSDGRFRALPCLAVLLVLGACHTPPGPRRELTNPDPAGKIPAMRQAVRQQDRSGIAHLVSDLDSDDPAVRFYAITALRELTGQDLGYIYYDDDPERTSAVERWKEWLASQAGQE